MPTSDSASVPPPKVTGTTTDVPTGGTKGRPRDELLVPVALALGGTAVVLAVIALVLAAMAYQRT